MAALDPRRLAMLQRMGVDVWRARGEDAEALTPELASETDAATPASMPVAMATAAPRDWPSSAELDWPALAACVADCTRCELAQGRTQTVFGVGDREARWLVVGEAPGAEEDKRGEPFVGRAGQLLNAMLAAIGLAREQVYIANILKCRPPANRDPKPDEVLACRGYLERQSSSSRPTSFLRSAVSPRRICSR